MNCFERTKKILTVDKKQDPMRIKKLIECDIERVLKNYVDLDTMGVECEIDVDEDGIHFNIYARAMRTKEIGILPI